jgi:NAD(P)-dependent dehydrogenase (short-subunit alcohol dehydrogenase family)
MRLCHPKPRGSDVSDATAVRRLFDAAGAEFGGVDALVNNAGMMMLAPIAESNDVSFDRQAPSISRAPSTACGKPRFVCAIAAAS